MSLEETTQRLSLIQIRLVDWAQQSCIHATDDTVAHNVILLAFHQATILLHRPSPSFPVPTNEALDVTMGAARAALRICSSAINQNQVEDIMTGWAGFNMVFTSGLTLLYCSWQVIKAMWLNSG